MIISVSTANVKKTDTKEIYSVTGNQLLGSLDLMSQKQVSEAIHNASDSQSQWAETELYKRAEILHAWADKLVENQEEIAQMVSEEVGKGLASAQKEVVRTADLIRYTAEEGVRYHGDMMKGDSFKGGSKDKIAMVEQEPLGVVLAISPFNYPVNLAASKIAPALITGNSVVFKPATQGALSGQLMIKALLETDLPEGVIQFVSGKGSEIGDFIVTHPKINMVTFTGSTEVGQSISQQAKMIPVVLELGGKDPAIVLEDADLELAAKNIVGGAFSYSGQRCTAIKRVLVADAAADELVEKIRKEIDQLSVGSPADNATITPLINDGAADKVENLITDAIDKGADLVVGNKREDNLIYPTLLDNVTSDMEIAWTEPFGPVLPVIRIQNEDDYVSISNESQYGLQASIFTEDVKKAMSIGSKLEVGSVQYNAKTERGPDHFPFIGAKNSGLGSQGIRRSIESMTRDKVFILNM